MARREMEARQAKSAKHAPPRRPDRWEEGARLDREDRQDREQSDSDTWRTVWVFLVVGALLLAGFIAFVVSSAGGR